MADLLHSDVWAGKDSAEVDLSTPEADAAAMGAGDGSDVEEVVRVIEPTIRAR